MVLPLTVGPHLVSLPPSPPSSIQHLVTFPALRHGLGSSHSAEPFAFVAVALRTGQLVFKVPAPAHGLGQASLLLPLVLPAGDPCVKSESKRLLPSGMGQPPRAVPLKAGASTSASPQLRCGLLAH